MGTRADFYVGRGAEAEWLGSVGWDGYPAGFSSLASTSEAEWRTKVAAEIAGREDGTPPEAGWPWPWEDSRTTDYAYAFDGGKVWASSFGGAWWPVDEREPEPEPPYTKVATFPDMTARRAVAQPGSKRSGVMAFTIK